MDSEPLLQVVHLTTRIRMGKKQVAVVEDVCFSLFPGKTLAIVGESGCGKSMTALSLMRILPHVAVTDLSSQVLYRKKDLLKLPEKEMRAIRGGRLAMIFQDPSSALNPVYKIGVQLLEVVELHLKLYGKAAAKRVLAALHEVGIPHPIERLESYPHQLSGGMKQRVMIAMALLCEPDLLIADEPTTALDVTIQAEVLDLMRALQAKKGTSLLLITHDMSIVAEMAHDVMVMYAAQIVESGSLMQIFYEKGHPYTQGLFASRPNTHKPKEQLYSIKGSVPAPDSYPGGCRFHPRCPYKMKKCEEGEVPFFMTGDKHFVKCWLHDGTEESMKKLGQYHERNANRSQRA